MARYLFRSNYTLEGTRGLHQQGGTARRAVVEKMVAAMGGRLEAFYFAFGDTDLFAIAELPDNVSASAISLAANAGGGAQVTTVPLLTCEEVDAACKKSVVYTPPKS